MVGENWTLMHDGAIVHRYFHKESWFEAIDMTVLEYPEKSTDLKIIENVGGMLASIVQKDWRKFQTTDDLKDAIEIAWYKIYCKYIKKLYKSILRRFIDVIENTRLKIIF